MNFTRLPFMIFGVLTIAALFSGAVFTTSGTAIALATPSPGAVCLACSVVSVSPGPEGGVPADLSSVATVTVIILDANSNPVPGATVGLNRIYQPQSFPDVTGSVRISPSPEVVSNASGVATFTLSTDQPQQFHFHVEVARPGSGTFLFMTGVYTANFYTPGPVPTSFTANTHAPVIAVSAESTVTVSPKRAPADGSAQIAVIVRLMDQTRVPAFGKTVTLQPHAGAGAGVSIAQTDDNGIAVFVLTSNSPASVLYSVYDASDQFNVGQDQATFTAVPAPTPTPRLTPKPTPPHVAPSVAVIADENGWSANALKYRGRNGQHFTYLCPTSGPPFPVGGDNFSGVYGTDTYTDDSPVCLAAVHAGLITFKGGEVTIEIRPRADSYTGSTRNGITTIDYGTCECGSYVFVGGAGGLPRLR
jgi:hypothetical protein